MQWKDISSHSQKDTDRTPQTWALKAAGLKIVITRHIYHAPDAWVLSCPPFGEGIEIGNGTADEAKSAAIEYVRANLERSIAALTPNADLCNGRHCDSAKQCQRAIRPPRGVLGKYAAYDITKDKDASACAMFIQIPAPESAPETQEIAYTDSEGGEL